MKATDYKHLNYSGIYLLRNTINDKVYVGQAGNIYHRIFEHLRARNSILKNKLYRASAKYGWDAFTCELLEKVDEPELLNERETFWIQHFHAHVNGYNICEFGGVTRNYRHSAETRQKMSNNRPSYEGELNPFFGKNHTDEARSKVGKANASYVRTEEHKTKTRETSRKNALLGLNRGTKPPIPVLQIDPMTMQVVRRWDSISDAARAVGAKDSDIGDVCKGKVGRKSRKGYLWKYA